jgi:hypothetical protein
MFYQRGTPNIPRISRSLKSSCLIFGHSLSFLFLPVLCPFNHWSCAERLVLTLWTPCLGFWSRTIVGLDRAHSFVLCLDCFRLFTGAHFRPKNVDNALSRVQCQCELRKFIFPASLVHSLKCWISYYWFNSISDGCMMTHFCVRAM